MATTNQRMGLYVLAGLLAAGLIGLYQHNRALDKKRSAALAAVDAEHQQRMQAFEKEQSRQARERDAPRREREAQQLAQQRAAENAAHQRGVDRRAAQKDAAALRPHLARFQDAIKVAASTPRIALSGPIINLQNVMRATEAVPVSGCMVPAKGQMVASMQQTIEGLLAFAARRAGQPYYDAASELMKNYISLRDACLG